MDAAHPCVDPVAISGGCTNGLLQDNVLYTEDNGDEVTCGEMAPLMQMMSVDVTDCSSNMTEAAWLGSFFAPTCCVDAAHPCFDPVAMSGGCTNGLLQDNVFSTEDNGPPACVESEYYSCMSTSSGSPSELCTCIGNIDTGSCDSDVQAEMASYVAGGCQNEDSEQSDSGTFHTYSCVGPSNSGTAPNFDQSAKFLDVMQLA